jgi:hypothetical protein
MRKILVTSVVLSGIWAGAVAHAYPFPTSWKKVLTCDGGAATIDINEYERRMVQLVIKDDAIYQYFRSNTRAWSTMKFDDQKKEIVVSGGLEAGVFSPEQFTGFQVNATMAPAAQIFRSGSGLLVRLVDLKHWVCTDYRENDYYCAEGYWTEDREIQNWFFRQCSTAL